MAEVRWQRIVSPGYLSVPPIFQWASACTSTARNRNPRVRAVLDKSAKTYRFDARLNEEQKLLIQRAADLEGRTMTDFVLRSAEAAAERTIETRSLLVLTARETRAFASRAA